MLGLIRKFKFKSIKYSEWNQITNIKLQNMKNSKIKLVFLIGSLLFSVIAFTQDNKSIELMKGNIEEAKKQVDSNILNPEKNQTAETWYLASYVYTRMAKSEVYLKLEAFPGEKALEFMKKSKALDTEQKLYSEQINVLLDLGPSFYNKAINNYNKAVKDSSVESYTLALRYFEDYFDLLNVLKEDKKFVRQIIEFSGVKHKDIYFYAGYSAQSIGNNKKALGYYSNLIDFKSDKATAKEHGKDLAYLYSAKIYASNKDYDNALKTIKRGVELFAENNNLVMTAIIMYKETDKVDDMITQMEEVVESNPNNVKLLFILARNYTKYGKQFAKNNYQSTSEKYYSKAINYYERAIALNPTDKNTEYSINYNLGILYYNRGAFEYKKGQKVDLEKFQEYFTKAKPVLQKAKEIKANPNIDKMLNKIIETLGE